MTIFFSLFFRLSIGLTAAEPHSGGACRNRLSVGLQTGVPVWLELFTRLHIDRT